MNIWDGMHAIFCKSFYLIASRLTWPVGFSFFITVRHVGHTFFNLYHSLMQTLQYTCLHGINSMALFTRVKHIGHLISSNSISDIVVFRSKISVLFVSELISRIKLYTDVRSYFCSPLSDVSVDKVAISVMYLAMLTLLSNNCLFPQKNKQFVTLV